MADLNVKNRSITPGDFEFSGGVVTAISGYPIGGTGGTIVGITYRGDGSTIDVNNDTRVITIHELTQQKIDSIPHKVSDLSDSANYYNKNECDERFVLSSDYNTKIVEIDSGLAYLSANKQDNLIFNYYNNSISAINGSAINVNGNFYSASNPSGFVNSEQVGTQIDEKLQNYYLKTDTSGKDELSDAFNNIMKYNVTAQQGCDVTSAVDNGVTTFGISITATPVVTDTTLSGYNGIAAAKDSDVSGQWNVGLTHDMLNTINGKLDSVSTDISLSGDSTIGSPLGIKTDASLNLTNTSAKSAVSAEWATKTMGSHTVYTLGSTLDTMSNITGLIDRNLMSMTGYNGIERQIDETTYYVSAFGLTNTAYGAVQYVTANSGKFVTSGDYISGSKQYALTSGGWKEIIANTDYTAGTDLKIDENNVISVDTNGNANNTATNNRNFVEGSWTIANGYNCHAEGIATSALGYGVHAQGMWTCFSSTNGQTTGGLAPIYWGIGAGATVEGYCNATTACPMSGTEGEDDYGPIHGGIIKVIGNGRVENEEHETDVHIPYPSDALILYRDGTMSAAGKISAAGIELGAEPDLSDYIPYSAISLPIGTNNNVTDYSMGIGYGNTANYGDVGTSQQVQYGSLAFGYQNSASKMSFAAGHENKALHVGFAVGYSCTATEHAVAMNNNCSANDYSFAEGDVCKSNNYSFAEGKNNIANVYSFAGGKNCSAYDYSFAYGEATTATGRSFAYGPANIAYNYSYLNGRGLEYSGASTSDYNLGAFVIGGWNATTSWETYASSPLFIIGNGGSTRSDAFVVYRNGAVRAGNNTTASGPGAHAEGVDAGAYGQGSHAGGYGTHTTGIGNFIHGTFLSFASPDATTVSNTPVFVGGTLNSTTAQNYNDHGGYLQIMGNGTYVGDGRGNNSDAYILYRDGTVKAKDFIAGGNTLSANYPVPKTVPNTADSTLKIQRMFVCTSDNDIIAHINAGLAEGEGCVFFRVG